MERYFYFLRSLPSWRGSISFQTLDILIHFSWPSTQLRKFVLGTCALFFSSFDKLAIKPEMPVAEGDDHWEHQCCHMQGLSMVLDSKEGVKCLASNLQLEWWMQAKAVKDIFSWCCIMLQTCLPRMLPAASTSLGITTGLVQLQMCQAYACGNFGLGANTKDMRQAQCCLATSL